MERRSQRLYQRDSFLTRFDATVLEINPRAAGSGGDAARLGLLLDRTAFYPTGGGQPCDRGTLRGIPVTEVLESDRGPIHLLEMEAGQKGAPSAGDRVEGVIDWPRRYDHMQQHSGQHLLSRAFLDLAGARTRSFHLGDSLCTLDIEMSPPHEGRIPQVEERTNEIIREDRPVTIREMRPGESGEAAQDPSLSGLKVKPGDPIRTIAVEGFDSTPCGGTHVRRTGQVALATISGWEPHRGMTRITFVCGGRVGERLKQAGAALGACISILSAPAAEVPEALLRLQREKEDLHRRVQDLTGDLVGYEAAAAAASAPQSGGFRILMRTFDSSEKPVDAAQLLVRRFVEEPGRLALVAVLEGARATVLAARSRGDGPSLGPLISEVAAAAGGRGGGSAAFGRAGGIPASRVPDVIEAAVSRITGAAPPGPK
jgi:alanyl-tRNA synthetase